MQLSANKSHDPSFWKYKAYADIHGVPLGGGVKWQLSCRRRRF